MGEEGTFVPPPRNVLDYRRQKTQSRAQQTGSRSPAICRADSGSFSGTNCREIARMAGWPNRIDRTDAAARHG